jgi:thiol-disulfide isomerase/thioredoxin
MIRSCSFAKYVPVLFVMLCAFLCVNAQSEDPQASPALMQTELKDIYGRSFRLEDFRGKAILVNLWGTWCPPCRAQVPMLTKLQAQYRSKGFEVIGIDVGDYKGKKSTEREIEIIADRLGVNYYLAYSTQPFIDAVAGPSREHDPSGLQEVPYNLFLDRDGRIRTVLKGQSQAIDRQITEAVNVVMSEH